MAEQRKTKRTKMVLPVKVVIDGTTHLAHTFDVTSIGARLGGLHASLKKGQMIVIQRGAKKAQFQVKWVTELSPTETQAGIQAIEQPNNFWGIDLTDQERSAKPLAVAAAAAATGTATSKK
jgi:hypothetical protein